MIPGMGRNMNPRQMNRMMKKLGIQVEDIEDVQEVIIKTPSKEYIIKNAAVTIMKAQGQDTFQVVGNCEVRQVEGAVVIPKEDIMLVMEQTGVSEEAAKKALEENEGNPAEAIMSLLG